MEIIELITTCQGLIDWYNDNMIQCQEPNLVEALVYVPSYGVDCDFDRLMKTLNYLFF